MKMKIISSVIKAYKYNNPLKMDHESMVNLYGEKLINAGIVGSLEIKVILPNCRKVQILSGFKINDTYYCRPLHGYSGQDEITLREYNQIIESAEIIPCDIFRDVKESELTEEIKQALKDHYKLKNLNEVNPINKES